MMMNIEADRDARAAISRDIDRNIFVEAGAGSGKTTQLVERMTAIVAAKDNVIGNICAITFTKAAAREFYSRFQLRLSEVIAETKDETVRKRCQNALDNIDLCFMDTIDAFSELILKEHPIEAGLRSDFGIMEDSRIASLCRHAIKDITAGEYGSKIYDLYLRLKTVYYDPEYIFTLLVKDYSDLAYTDISIPVFEHDIDKAFDSLKNEIMPVFDALMNNPGLAYKSKTSVKDPDKHIRMLENFKPAYQRLKGNWSECFSELKNLLNMLDGYYISSQPGNIGILHTELFEEIKNRKNTFKFVPKNFTKLFQAIDEYVFCTAVEFFVPVIEELTRRNIARGQLTFTDAKYRLRDMLKNDAENGGRLIRHIRKRRSIFLADEFQDTDPVQSEILFYLTAETPRPDMSDCVPVQGSLFIVGDPKQSIYRFRGADIKAYIKIREKLRAEGGEVLSLTRNFRSTVTLREKFNRAFEKLLPADTEYQSKFSPIPILPEEKDDPDIFTGAYTYAPGNSDPYKVAEIIRSLVADKSRLVPDKDPETKRTFLRPVQYKDIMVIVFAKRNINKYISAFRSCGIPCFAEGSSTMDRCEALLELIKVFTALAKPDNSLAVFTALTSKVLGITEKELSEALPKFTLYSKDKTASTRINEALADLRKLYYASRVMLPSAVFGRVMNKLKLLTRVPAGELECLCFAEELLRSAEVNGEVSDISEAAALLRDLVKNKPERTLQFDCGADSVHIANLHKVKGLERNIVILGSSPARESSPGKAVVRGDDKTESWIFSIYDGEKSRNVFGTKTYFRPQFAEEQTAAEAETDRLIYVAATRARCALIISENGEPEENLWGPLLMISDGELVYNIPEKSGEPEEVTAASEYFAPADDPFKNADVRGKSYKLVLPSNVKSGNKFKAQDNNSAAQPDPDDTALPDLEAEIEKEEQDTDTEEQKAEKAKAEAETAGIKRNAALIGTLVHRLMERLVSAPTLRDKDKVVSAVVNELDGEAYRGLLGQVFDTVTNGGFPQTNGRPQDILAELADAENIMCETPFCYERKKDGKTQLCNGVIDLIYRKNGRLVIVDYKTTAEKEHLEQNYEGQLGEYRSAVKQLLGEEAEAWIYHIDAK